MKQFYSSATDHITSQTHHKSLMRAFLQILGTGARDSPPSVLLFFDNHRYLFNAGEGAQRVCINSRTKLQQINHLFLTSSNWVNTGGLPGLLLTLADGGTKAVGVTGPNNLHHLLYSTRHFVTRYKISSFLSFTLFIVHKILFIDIEG